MAVPGVPTPPVRPPQSLGSFVAGFKSSVTTRVNTMRGTRGRPVWQRGYWDRVIRDQSEWDRIRWYINANPCRWRAMRVPYRAATPTA